MRLNQAYRQRVEPLAVADALELLVPRKAQPSHGRSVWRREGLVQRIENDQRWLEDIKHLIALREGP